MKEKLYSRKNFIGKVARLGSVVLSSGLVVSSCRSDRESEKESTLVESCDDLSGLSRSEIAKRDVYGYVGNTPYAQYRCENCSLFIPPEEGEACGRCILFEGPVLDDGYCDYWEPRET